MTYSEMNDWLNKIDKMEDEEQQILEFEYFLAQIRFDRKNKGKDKSR